MKQWLVGFAAPIVLLAGCRSDGTAANQVTPPAPVVAYLSPTDHLVRVSMALRGTRPSLAELARVHGDPSTLPAIVDDYLASPEFGATVRDVYNEGLDVRVPAALFPAGFPAVGGLAGVDVQAINESVTQAPLRLIEWVVTHDRPLTEILTADYTVADGNVAQVWGLAYDGAGPGDWRVTHWTDGRAPAGILSDSWLFTRHATTYSNSNRGRANQISRSLLCFDFLNREIAIDATINLADPMEVAHAVQKNDSCASCHHQLDPLASYFGSFYPLYVPSDLKTYPFKNYDPLLAPMFTITAPAYFGQNGAGLDYLGKVMAEDPRFSLCAAKRFYSYLNHSRVDDVPSDRAGELQATLESNGMSAKALARAVVLSDDFRVSHALTDDPNVDPNGVRKIRPSQLARMTEDLTGFRWQTRFDFDLGYGKVGTIDLLSDSLLGYEVLAGGIDSQYVTLPSHTMNASASLVLRALAARAAPFVVDNDFAAPQASRKLLTLVGPSESGEAAVRAQLASLELRLYGAFVDPQSDDVTLAWQLFSAALASSGGDVKHAWTTTLFAMLQDARIAYF